MEMVDSVEGRWKDNSNIKMLQDSFNRIFKKNLISNNLRYLFGTTNLWQSSSFLNKNSWWIK